MKRFAFGLLLASSMLVPSCGEKEKEEKAATPKRERSLARLTERNKPERKPNPETEGYILAKDALPSVGTIRTEETATEMPGSKLIFETGGQAVEGKMTNKESSVETLEVLEKTKVRRTLVSSDGGGAMILNGEEHDNPAPPDPLTGIPVIIESKGGKWIASLEDGTPTPEQQQALSALAIQFATSRDIDLYGATPRRPGDKWTVTGPAFGGFNQMQGVKGTVHLEFLEVKDFQGISCALLKVTMNVAGSIPAGQGTPPMKVTMNGEGLIHRSLEQMLDLDTSLKIDSVIEGNPSPEVTLHAEGPMTMTVKATQQ